VFDVESVADGKLIAGIRYAGEGGAKAITPQEAIARYRAELLEKSQGESDFIPYTFQIPISVAIAKIDVNYHLRDVVVLDDPRFRPHQITRDFWRGWACYEQPTLVSFNGRGFDLPLLELAAFRYGESVPKWFNFREKNFDQNRYRYNIQSHLDLMDVLTNYGATRFPGGLNLAAQLLGKPGKMDTLGYMVQDLYDRGELARINDYCRCDVLDTYFVFLRVAVLLGNLSIDDEHERVAEAKNWIADKAREKPVFRQYLDNWGSWENPWQD
jgi:predicted PolB exonuclease-like 3'-5' exonuclease